MGRAFPFQSFWQGKIAKKDSFTLSGAEGQSLTQIELRPDSYRDDDLRITNVEFFL